MLLGRIIGLIVFVALAKVGGLVAVWVGFGLLLAVYWRRLRRSGRPGVAAPGREPARLPAPRPMLGRLPFPRPPGGVR